MRVVHLYPFAPSGRHGGTLRLAAAVAAGATLGESEVHWFDAARGAWRGPLDRDSLERRIGEPEPAPPGAERSLKRRLFPSTLWESGRRARGALAAHRGRLLLDPEAVVHLHTTYLAGLARELAAGACGSVVDVYDLVWRAHRNDALATRGPVAALRASYSRAVAIRELAALAGAGAVVVAGYQDHAVLAQRICGARWIPTPTPVGEIPAASQQPALRVGMLGNFAHASTRASAERLIGSPLAGDPSVSLVFAGLGSRAAIERRPRIEVLGELARAEDFYARVECVVAPVVGGSGIACKLGEGLLAGRPVITTPLGAAGYPPAVRRQLAVCDPDELDAPRVRRACAAFEPAPAREAAARELGQAAVIRAYAEVLRGVAGGAPP